MKTFKLISAFVIFITLIAFPQNEEKLFVVASYNVENLFDTINDPTIDDEQFLPSDSSKWNSEKYSLKLKNLAAVIDSMNEGRGPDILGLIEVENKAVIEDLIAKLGNGKKYEIVHYDSPDGRGIDVALI
ncbi:MAG: endonuclease/exonuclease/phosphatase family protein, partial [Ignavibacteriaceae bacterium]|nr:endonuclease/exonuclease/phosphatase family protein [Ignavibacteriaceae bacterium]